MSARDPVVLALAGIAAGACSGAAVVTVGLMALRGFDLAQRDAGTLPFLVISLSTLAGVVVAATMTWTITAAIDDAWRRGVSSAMAVMVAFVAGAATAPMDMIGGIPALGLYLLALAIGGAASYRKALQAIQ